MRDVAVRDQVIRSSADLTPELREMLDGIPIGQLTAPEVTQAGRRDVCALRQAESKIRHAPANARPAMTCTTKRFETDGQALSEPTARAAMIEHK